MIVPEFKYQKAKDYVLSYHNITNTLKSDFINTYKTNWVVSADTSITSDDYFFINDKYTSSASTITYDSNFTTNIDSTSNDLFVVKAGRGGVAELHATRNFVIYQTGSLEYTNSDNVFVHVPLSKKDRMLVEMRQRFRKSMRLIETRYKPVHIGDDAERRAQQLLKTLVSPEEFKRYLKRGFITERGPTGRVYQIFGGYDRVRVFDGNKPSEFVCIVFKTSGMPHTDWVVMRLLMIRFSEEEFLKIGVRSRIAA